MKTSRREFIKQSAKWSLSLGVLSFVYFVPKGWTAKKSNITKALYYKKLSSSNVKCLQCPRQCVLIPKKRGFCRVRENMNGELYSLVYENPCAVHIDHIEKKPLFHVLPTSKSFSISTAGCNLRCKFCQNWQISQRPPEDTTNYNYNSQDIVILSKKYKCASIAYTYTEPTIFYEYMLEIAELAKENSILDLLRNNSNRYKKAYR
ncbi:MAG: radical SAM protein, partial [bacterium]|nr:radical SAM protein [bacterium]